MSVVYRTSDVIDVKVGDVTFKISPLNYKVKADMQASVMAGRPMDAAVTALKHGIKGAEGLLNSDGSQYEFNFTDNGVLDEACVDDLLNIPESSKLNLIAISLIHGMPQGEFLDPDSGKPLSGVKIVSKGGAEKKSRRKRTS